jgi:SSS family solute:Na+ symporter
MNLSNALDLVVVAIYLLGTLGIGARFLKRSSTTEGFTVGCRSVPAWAVGLSMLGVFVSSISFVGNPGKAYADNWAPLLFAFTVPLVAIIAGRWFVPIYRSVSDVSAYALLERRFGYWARAYGSLSFQLLQLGRVSVILYFVGLVVAPILQVPVTALILVVGLLVAFYTTLGGIQAVIWTDVVQVIVMFGGALWCLLLIFNLMPGGAPQVFSIAWEAGGKFELGKLSLEWENQTLLGVLLFGILANLQNFGIDQNFVQRYHTAGSERKARKALVVATLPFIPVTALFLMIGTALFSFYRVFPELLAGNVEGDAVFPYFIGTQLPAGVRGLLAACILAAAMSTISSSLNCMATVFVEDFWQRLWRPSLTQREHVRILRLLTAVSGALGVLLSFAIIGARSGLDLFWELSAVIGSALLGIFLLAILPWRIHRTALILATSVSVLFVLWGTLSREIESLPLRLSLDPLLTGAIGTVLLMFIALAASRLVPGWRTSTGENHT